MVCEVHKLHAVAGSLLALVPFFTSGLLKAALALRSGQMAFFRRVLRGVLREKIKIYRTDPGDINDQYRHFCCRLFFSTLTTSEQTTVMGCLNGAWQCSSEIQHICRGCCKSDDHAREKVMFCFLGILVKSGPRVWPRHKWLGCHDCLDFFARLSVIHDVLGSVIQRMFGPKSAATESKHSSDPNHLSLDLDKEPQEEEEAVPWIYNLNF